MAGLSVIIPVYNVEEYISECLDSLLRQNIDDIEIIAVDDGSKDGSGKILDDYAEKHPKYIKAIHNTNRGPGGSRNVGIRNATKEYIAFLDSDDYIIDGGYLTILEKMERDGADIAVFEGTMFYPDGKTEFRPSLPGFLDAKDNKTYILSNCAPWNKIYKTKLWQNVIEYPENIWYEDLAVIPAFATMTDKIVWYDDAIYMYRQRDYSIMSKNVYSPKCMDIIPACDTVYKLLRDKGFEAELEYLMLFQLCYFASFRFLPFKKYKEIGKCIESLNEKYPKWRENSYYISRPRLFKMYCELLAKGKFKTAALLNKAKTMLGK